jgi:hypothetical protein
MLFFAIKFQIMSEKKRFRIYLVGTAVVAI